MLQRWKRILTNWNNCYFSANTHDEQKIDLDSLINIIAHLRHNYNLDESKSSVLQAHTVNEFINEKYPQFHFENGTTRPTSEDDFYLVASLLLFFVCVNSKDVDIKNAMCSKLCYEDQETILKFSKSLLGCPSIGCSDVQSAITEACGQEIAAMEAPTVAETPPALRSLHGEVRRLQASLDAERFDRNFLQEELARTNARVDKLLKEKEQHKLEIVNLKAKISLCGDESVVMDPEAEDRSAKLTKQLNGLEEKLIETQELLDDVVHHRDTYKAKVEQLKTERDKLLALHEAEASRASKLSEELDSERLQSQTLQEMLTELRQHHKLNGLDTSSLECDDADTSNISLPHNASICNEACANVVEVQLGEERAKMNVLKQQMQTLQDQMNELIKKTDAEKLTLKNIAAEKDHIIVSLKHRINEEIEEKNYLKSHYDDEITKLNNELNELEQTLKDKSSHSRAVIEQKMQEIQTVQEEKISLLQSFECQKNKLEKIINDLRAEIETEKQSKSNMKDSYENHLMKLNEKVLKRNNELVKFQNNICEKSEMIETLQLQLKKEKEAGTTLTKSLSNEKIALKNELNQQLQKIEELGKNLQESNIKIEELSKELAAEKATTESYYINLEDIKEKLEYTIKLRDEALNDIDVIKEEQTKDKNKLNLDLDEKNETINSLQLQLKHEIQFKVELQNELFQLHTIKKTMTENIEKYDIELKNLKSDIENNEKTIDAMDLYIKEEKKTNEEANKNIENLTEEIQAKDSEILQFTSHIESLNKTLQDEIKSKNDVVSVLEPLQEQMKSFCDDNTKLQQEVSAKCQELLKLRHHINDLLQQIDHKDLLIQVCEQKIIEQCKRNQEFEFKSVEKLAMLSKKINETNANAEKLVQMLNKEIAEKQSCNNELKITVEKLTEDLLKSEMELKTVKDKLADESGHKLVLETNQQIQFTKIENLTKQFNSEIESRNAEIKTLMAEIQTLTTSIQEKSADVIKLQEQHKLSEEAKIEACHVARSKIAILQNKVIELEELNKEIEQEIKKEQNEKEIVVNALKQQNEKLLNSMERDNSNHEIIFKEKDQIIRRLENTIKKDATQLNELHIENEKIMKSWDEYKYNAIAELNAKDNEISTLKNDSLILKSQQADLINEKDSTIMCLKESATEEAAKYKMLHEYSENLVRSWEDYKHRNNEILNEKDEEIVKLRFKISALEQTILELDQNNKDLERQILQFEQSKTKLENMLSETEITKHDVELQFKNLIQENQSLLSLKDQLELEVKNLNQELYSDKCDIQKSENEKCTLMSEKGKVEEQLTKSSEIVNDLVQHKERLAKQLVAEKQSTDVIVKENGILIKENETLKMKVNEGEKVKSELSQELQGITQQVEDLQKTLKKEKKANGILEQLRSTLNIELDQVRVNEKCLAEENQKLLNDKVDLNQKLEDVKTAQASLVVIKDLLNAEKATLKNSLDIQIDKIETLEKENLDLKAQINELNVEINDVQAACNDLLEKIRVQNSVEDSIANQIKERLCETIRFIQENGITTKLMEHSIDDIDVTENGMNENKTSNKLKHETMMLLEQNEKLLTMFNEEKSAREELQSEKNNLVKTFTNLQGQFQEMKNNLTDALSDVKNNYNKASDNLRNKEDECKLLQAAQQAAESKTSLISNTISEGLDNLLLKFKNENFNNPLLQQIIDVDHQEIELNEKCNLVISIANALTSEIDNLKNLEIVLKNENTAISDIQETLKQKELEISNLKSEIMKLRQTIHENKIELSKKDETYCTSMNAKIKDIQTLQNENQALHDDLSDVKSQLEMKVNSLKEKLTDNENLTDKLKKTYECQIENLNIMITKLTQYLKDKTAEMDGLRKEKEQLNKVLVENREAIKSLQDEVKTEKQNVDKIITDFDAERQVLKNMVTVTEAVMEDQKTSLSNVISEHATAKEILQGKVDELNVVVKNAVRKHKDMEAAFDYILCLLRRERVEKGHVEQESEELREFLDELISELGKERNRNQTVISYLETQNNQLIEDLDKYKNDIGNLQRSYDEVKITNDTLQNEIISKNDELSQVLQESNAEKKSLNEKITSLTETQIDINKRLSQMDEIVQDKEIAEQKVLDIMKQIEDLKSIRESNENTEIIKLQNENEDLTKALAENKTVITNLEQLTKHELEQNRNLREGFEDEKITLTHKCATLKLYQEKAEKVLEERQKEIDTLQKELKTLKSMAELCEQDSKAKDGLISKMSKEKDAIITTISKELFEEKIAREKFEKELENQKTMVHELRNNMEMRALKKENEQLIRAIGQQETFAALCQDKVSGDRLHEPRDVHQVDNTSSDNTQSSMESLKTITDLERIIHDKNRTITTLQQDVTYLKTLIADSETKLMDVTKELEVSKENCQQLSSQLKKIVYQKNEELADLKKQVSKMSVTENRASQIIKVSAKYQAIILRRIAEIKSNTILKELTNFGNTNCDSELKRRLNAGTVTMEDLENFLETTDRHLRRCSEKQVALSKERDRLTEVNRINESEIINLKKFLTELSVSFQTFTSVKDLYAQKLSRVISVQRTVRREILNLESKISDAAMFKLERGYAAVMQDLSECAMNLERWVERCISRTVSVEKIKQAFVSDTERSSLSSPSFQNTGLEIQLDELDKSFQKLLEDVARAAKGDGSKDTQAATVMEVRAEYEDKLNRMKSKMKELFNEQMGVFKEKQREEISILERELQKAKDKMEDTKKEYDKYIRQLTNELWNVGEKYLVKNDEAEWLKKKQMSGSFTSLQHVHSSGLMQHTEPPSRPSDASSLRSLQINNDTFNTKKRERQMHMSDEEGEVFDNRWLKELSTPRRELPPGQRLSELKWRNSLCPPHLKSSYPAETQFAPALDEEDLKAGAMQKPQRKEVGITAYKKPGPPTPSKQAGRLSATGSELRESLRPEPEPLDRKTSTPARIRNFLRFHRNDTTTEASQGTPRVRRLSNIFRKNR